MTKTLSASLAFSLLMASVMAGTAQAQTWSGAVSVVSERVSRGISMSGDQPAAIADFTYRNDRNWALGLGLATVHGQGDAKAEGILSATRWWQIDDHRTLTVSAAYYGYAGGGDSDHLRYVDLSAGALWDSPVGQWAASVSLSPDLPVSSQLGYLGHLGGTVLELTWHKRLVGAVSADLGWGVVDNWGHRNGSYRFVNAGASYALGDWRFGLVRLVSTVPRGPDGVRARWIGSVSWAF